MLYLIHFNRKYRHAGHYRGYCDEKKFASRMERHRSGSGAKLLRVIQEAGIGWVVAATFDGGRDEERNLKKKSIDQICPICNPSLIGGTVQFNKVMIAGKISAPVSTTELASGGKVWQCRLAYPSRKKINGEWVDCESKIEVKAFNKKRGHASDLADRCAGFPIGASVLVCGKIIEESWVDDGVSRTRHVVDLETMEECPQGG